MGIGPGCGIGFSRENGRFRLGIGGAPSQSGKDPSHPSYSRCARRSRAWPCLQDTTAHPWRAGGGRSGAGTGGGLRHRFAVDSWPKHGQVRAKLSRPLSAACLICNSLSLLRTQRCEQDPLSLLSHKYYTSHTPHSSSSCSGWLCPACSPPFAKSTNHERICAGCHTSPPLASSAPGPPWPK